MDDVIYFSVNNWFKGRDYPKDYFISTCVESNKFADDSWCKENSICVAYGYIDMSINFCVSATREWVELNCPKLLSDDTYTYVIRSVDRDGQHDTTYTKQYSDFVYSPDEEGYVEDRFGWSFLEYCNENFGSHFVEYDYDYFDDEEEDDE